MSEFLKDYDFEFPGELVAQEPLPERDGARMMVVERGAASLRHARFRELPSFLREGDLLVVNTTQVVPCRLFARKPTGGRVEIFVLGKAGEGEYRVWFSPARGLKEGLSLELISRDMGIADSPPRIEVSSLREDDCRVALCSEASMEDFFSRFGEMPLPPYIDRSAPRETDRERYQTVFARHSGAVAAPTAGLHFTDEIQAMLKNNGIAMAEVCLHVGPGTFLPVKVERIGDHVMHRETYEIPESTQEAVASCKRGGGRVIPVGTTSLRALESWALTGEPRGETELFIRPGFAFRVADALFTNFHQPRSTLLMLVSALAGREFILSAYQEAIREGYRLFSYGDCMLII